MLSYLKIKNFAIIQQSEIHFKQGMTTITGETGAGKSILIDALNIVLGARVDKTAINQQTCEISAIFLIDDIPQAKSFIQENELGSESECILRRVVYKDGRTRAFINDTPVTLQQLKKLSQHIMSLYGQNAHHSLLENDVQLERLDTYAGLLSDVEVLSQIYAQLQRINTQINLEQQRIAQQQTQQALLQYQYDELSQLTLHENELATLDDEQKKLASAEDKTKSLYHICDQLYESEHSIINQLEQLITLANTYETDDLNELNNLLDQAKVYLQEAVQEAKAQQNNIEINPEKLAEIENRLDEIHTLARKHKIAPTQLYEYAKTIAQQLEQLEKDADCLAKLQTQKISIENDFYSKAQKLSQKRQQAAKTFAKEVQHYIRKLNIPHGEFYVKIHHKPQPSATGSDQCEFLINFNKGQTPSPIDKVASGGELSRIGLAVHVVSSKKIAPPTLIFDEVDVGISGATAEVVGHLLKQIAQRAQILCITHQAQVSIQGDQQLHIIKKHFKDATISQVIELTPQQRIEETARIIGGVDITDKTRQHAKEMYELFHP
ncbi:DNA repair protein RecN [Facilibium subflavum]|uniref:DNA repair protein RecN n=1 Tax=Facilibium subflavum TaxID=2219058 RepID=UPI000E6519EA|nr:DNA repair protein RecN [Facilibium subflavum]